MDSQPASRDEIEPGSRATNWIGTAVGGGFGIAGAGFAVAAFALRAQRWVLSSRTLYAILGLLFLYGLTMVALVRRLSRRSQSTPPKATTPTEAEGLTRRVRLLRGTDDL
jgi:hypothetical protein